MYADERAQQEHYRVIGDVSWRLERAGPAGMSADALADALGEELAAVRAAVDYLAHMRIAEHVPGDISGRMRHWTRRHR